MKTKHIVKTVIPCRNAEEMQQAKAAVLYHLETLNPEFVADNNTLTVSVPPSCKHINKAAPMSSEPP